MNRLFLDRHASFPRLAQKHMVGELHMISFLSAPRAA